jgi:hypothetical protein
VVEPLVLHDIEKRSAGAGLGVWGAEDESWNPGQDDRARAHGTGFQRHIERTRVQTAGSEICRCGGDGNDLGMGGRILEGFNLVVAASDDSALVDDNRSNGDFLSFIRLLRFPDGGFHPALVFGH